MSKLIFVALLAICVVALANRVSISTNAEAEFEQFIEDYGREYSRPGERYQRFLNFKKTLERIEKKNRSGGAVYGITKFADWSEDELRARKLIPFSPEVVVKTCLAPNVTKYGYAKDISIHDIKGLKAIPTAYDWRTKGVVTPVKNQGQCGSCWTFSTAGNIESQYAIAGNPLTNLSEQMIVDCSTACVMEDGQSVCNDGCGGGWMWSAMTDIMSWGGLETEAAYPYTAETGTCHFDKKKAKLFAPIQNYTCIGTSEVQMALQLVARGPLSMALNADMVEDYTSGIIIPSNEVDDCDPSELDHALLIVGYGVEGKTPFWIVKNSWGADWGEEGYFRIIRGVGACGINEAVLTANLAPKTN